MNDFTDKVAVVTGSDKGIGAAVGRAFANDGAAVVLVDIDTEAANETAAAVAESGGRTLVITTDVGDPEHVRAIAASAVEGFGGINYLFANAGIQHYGTVLSTEPEAWDAVLRTNLTSVYLGMKYCAERMLARGSGAIDLAEHGVRVNSISPGNIRTPLAGGDNPEANVARSAAGHVLKRIGEPEEVADLVLFLCSEHASFITRANYLIDGGLTIRLPI